MPLSNPGTDPAASSRVRDGRVGLTDQPSRDVTIRSSRRATSITDLIYGTDIEQPGNAAGTSSFGTALADAVTNGTPAVPATADFPAYPAISASQWRSALDTAVFYILSTMNKAGLLEGTQYGSSASTWLLASPPA